jgi:NOL1/NOP2/fmu family ribosome biogenesis protein
MMPILALNPKEDEILLDLCAAPGGKTTVLASLPQFKMVLANELIKSRVNILYENIVKWGTPHVLISNNDPSDFTHLKSYFDTILVDAPCSGSGLFRKDPKAINEWSENNVKLCAERQKRILADVLPSLKEGGILVYATCSYSREENEEIMDWLMQHAVFEPITVDLNDSWNVVETHSERGGVGYRFFPGKSNGEGFFIACFKLVQSQQSTWFSEKKLEIATAAEICLVKEWVNQDFFTIVKKNESLMVLPEEIAYELQILQQFLYLRKSGVLAGTVIRNQFIPEHELILSTYCNNNLPFFEVNEVEVIQYLKKQNFNNEVFRKGWYIIRYNKLRLGLIKHLGNRINNYYPAAWRILKS